MIFSLITRSYAVDEIYYDLKKVINIIDFVN